MNHIILPTSRQESLAYYLAAEEYLALNDIEGFFVWQCRPTVIYGRNQDVHSEVDTVYCAEHGIKVYRRKSGGGCVYADKGNLMLSYIRSGTDVRAAFEDFLGQLSSFLTSIGLDAVVTQHNDILVGGRKVSGNACFSTGRNVIVHGTLLYDENIDVMLRAITPSSEKLASHKVESVRQRCVNLREVGVTVPLEELKKRIVEHFCSSDHFLGAVEDAEIRKIESTYSAG